MNTIGTNTCARRMRNITAIGVLAVAASCATAPKTAGERRDLEAQANATLSSMQTKDPGLAGILDSAAGYAVFPEIGKGGLIAGAAYGRGVLFVKGRKSGFVELNQASLGAQIGAQTFTELIVFRNNYDVERLKAGTYSLGANMSAIVLKEGAAASADFAQGVAVFVVPRGGVMAELSLSGQKINFEPRGG